MAFQLTAARRRLVSYHTNNVLDGMFQLTAARRRLVPYLDMKRPGTLFQLTAARRRLARLCRAYTGQVCFNSQPPEGGWCQSITAVFVFEPFQLTAARRRLVD